MSCFGKFYSPWQIYEIIDWYWALENEFHYPMTPRYPYSDVIMHTMQQEWMSRVNQDEYWGKIFDS